MWTHLAHDGDYGNEPLGTAKDEEFIGQLGYC